MLCKSFPAIMLTMRFLLTENCMQAFDQDGVHDAIASGDTAAVQRFIDQNSGLINQRDSNGLTLLHWAATYGREEIVRILCTQPTVNVDQQDNYGLTPLLRAAMNGHKRAVCCLLMHNADLQIHDKEGIAPLDYFPLCKKIYAKVQGMRAARQNTAIALLVGLHPRTGANSPIGHYISVNFVRMLMKYVPLENFQHYAHARPNELNTGHHYHLCNLVLE